MEKSEMEKEEKGGGKDIPRSCSKLIIPMKRFLT
jgi:hypothetical protein